MAISVIKPGLLDSLQDSGRFGFSNWGINPGGSMDRFAGSMANLLVGNNENAAVLEIHFPGPQLLFEQNALIALTGADFSPMLNDELVPMWQPIVVRKNTLLHFPKLNRGARCYLSVHGGFCSDTWLNSHSTHLKAGVGGFHGQALKKGDELQVGNSSVYFAGMLPEEKTFRALPWRANVEMIYRFPHEILILEGHEWDLLTTASRHNLLENNFMVHPSSDRMGYTIKGSRLDLKNNTELVSTGVDFGTLQLLPGGELIILMADHQTTGGYPRIGHVISAHLPKLAQLRPSDCIKFTLTDIEHAEELLLAQAKEIQILQHACKERLNEQVCKVSI